MHRELRQELWPDCFNRPAAHEIPDSPPERHGEGECSGRDSALAGASGSTTLATAPSRPSAATPGRTCTACPPVVERDPAARGFVVVPRRWVVERSFGWLAHWNGLLRDRAGRLDVSAGRLAFVAVLSGVEALINPMPSHETAD
jgi:hypothetical protein